MSLKLFYSVAYAKKHENDSQKIRDTFNCFEPGQPFAVYEAGHEKILPATYIGPSLPANLRSAYPDYREIGIAKAGHASLLVSRKGEITGRAKEIAAKMDRHPDPDFFRKLAMDNLKQFLSTETLEEKLERLIPGML